MTDTTTIHQDADDDSATHQQLRDILTKAGYPPGTLPTDEANLIPVIRAVPYQLRYLIPRELGIQLGGNSSRAVKLYDRAEEQIRVEDEITRQRQKLVDSLTSAAAALHTAKRAYRELAGNELYDIQIAESETGTMIDHYLDKAYRATQVAARFAPAPDPQLLDDPSATLAAAIRSENDPQ